MKNYFYLFSIIVVLMGCQTEKLERDSINIKIDHIADSIGFDSLISEYRYVELSSENGFVLGEIDQVIIDNNRIYISSNGVYCFDMNGNSLFKITSKGRARNEFIECTSVSINDGIIHLYDRQTKLIHRYNGKTGSFVDNISVPVVSRDIYKIDDGYVIDHLFPTDFYSGNARVLTTKDFSRPNGEYLKEKQYHKPIVNQVTYCGKSVLFADYDGHTIFSFDHDGCKKYDIQCDVVMMMPQDILDKRDENNQTITETYTHGLSMVYENDTHLIGAYQWGTPFKFVYNKKTGETISFLDYFSEKYRLSPYDVRGSYKNYFVGIISPDDFDFLKEAYGFGSPLPTSHPEYEKQKILMEHNTDGNPIIALYKFKEF